MAAALLVLGHRQQVRHIHICWCQEIAVPHMQPPSCTDPCNCKHMAATRPRHCTDRCSRTLPHCHVGGQGRYSHAPAQPAAPRGSAAVQPRPPGRAAPLGGASAQHVQRPCLTLVLRLVASLARHAARLLLQPQLRQVSHLQMCLQVHAAQGGGHHACVPGCS